MLKREPENQVGGKAIEKLVVNGQTVAPITMQEIIYQSRNVQIPDWAVKADIYMLAGGGDGERGGVFKHGMGGTAGKWERCVLHQLHGGGIEVTIGAPGEPTRIKYFNIESGAHQGIHGGNTTYTGVGAKTFAHTRGNMVTHPSGSRKKYVLRGSNNTTLPGWSSKGFGGGGAGGSCLKGAPGKGSPGVCYIFFSNTR